ncbi:hypothetical protein IT571_02385 [Candidatus Sumerlaeota bacterium]|nr:hypothetical protein [Candidatus Sumerlaeota bacterium]
MIDERYHPPFVHPRRDPHIKRARFLASAFLSVANGVWFVGFAWLVMWGTALSPMLCFTALVGLIWIGLRAREVSELAFALVDRSHVFEMAPSHSDVLFRFIVGCVAPALCLIVAVLAHGRDGIMLVALFLFFVAEAAFRFGGLKQWRSTRIPFPVLRALLTATPNAAMQALEEEKSLRGPALEMTVLAISSAALRDNASGVLSRLIAHVESRPSANTNESEIFRRLIAVLRADEAIIAKSDDMLKLQAEALMAVPPLHPRRSSLAFLVAASAMESGDHASAIKALRLLHAGEVLSSPPRLLVDWMLEESARMTGDDELVGRAQAAIRTFHVARVLSELNMNELRKRDDPMARMICTAHDALKASLQNPERNAPSSS